MKPTIGRKVWLRLNGATIGVPGALQPQVFDPKQALDATVVFVHDEAKVSVNLFVVDHGGFTHSICSVPLRQDGEAVPTGMYCEWMPYQVAQAKKDEPIKAVTDATIEAEIVTKGLTAPRVTPADIEDNIFSEFYFTGADGVLGESQMGTKPAGLASSLDLLTFCVLVLSNGFTVTGESACASSENFDAAIGRKIARQNAVQKIWPLMGYELRSKLMQD